MLRARFTFVQWISLVMFQVNCAVDLWGFKFQFPSFQINLLLCVSADSCFWPISLLHTPKALVIRYNTYTLQHKAVSKLAPILRVPIFFERNPVFPELCQRAAVWTPQRRGAPCCRLEGRAASSRQPRTARQSPPPWWTACWSSWTASIAAIIGLIVNSDKPLCRSQFAFYTLEMMWL